MIEKTECSADTLSDMKYIQDTLFVISGKWKIQILISLHSGNNRYLEIAKSIPKITSRMLSKELKELELNKLILRTVNDKTSVLVEYKLTEYSLTLWPLFQEMIKWAKYHRITNY